LIGKKALVDGILRYNGICKIALSRTAMIVQLALTMSTTATTTTT
jgi:hypothetical protein